MVREEGRDREIVFLQEADNVPLSLGILLDTGSAMSAEQIRTGKELVFALIHKLDPEDEVLLGMYDRDVHFLSPLSTDRVELLEAIRNISSGGRPGLWSRLSQLFASDGYTGGAVDDTLLELKTAKHRDRVLLVISAAFGNIGEATLDHIQEAGVRFFAVTGDNKLGDVFNLGGDKAATKKILEETGGVAFDADSVAESIQQLHDTLKHYYLIAYEPADIEKSLSERKVEFNINGHPEYRIHVARRVAPADSFFSFDPDT